MRVRDAFPILPASWLCQRSPRPTPGWTFVAGVCLLCALHGCERPGAVSSSGVDAEPGITRSADEGPVSATLTVSPKAPDVLGTVRVRIEILADTTVTVIEPDYGDVLREGDRVFEYSVKEVFKERAKPVGGGRLLWAYAYDLKFVLSGEYELPGVEVSFTALDPDGSAQESTLTTEPIKLAVTAPEEAALSDAELRTVTRPDPIDLPWAWSGTGWLVAVAVAALLLVGAIMVWRKRRGRRNIEIPIPADVWARSQIAILLAEELLEKGMVQEFHYRISGIVRGYIERRYGVSAPEMTTEEFLATTASDNRFGQATSDELDKFLCACDLVKYAKHLPGPGECEGVLKAAGDFVERTRERVVPEGSIIGQEVPVPAEERAA